MQKAKNKYKNQSIKVSKSQSKAKVNSKQNETHCRTYILQEKTVDI
jgi:hypothetical protein